MSRRILISTFVLALLLCGSLQAEDVDPTGEKEMETLLPRFQPVDDETFRSLQKLDPVVLKPDTLPQDVLKITPELARVVTDSLIRRHWGTLEFFATSYFVKHRQVFYYSPDVLETIVHEYDIPGIFPPQGATRRNVQDGAGEIPAGTPFKMEGLLLGAGRIVVIYPHAVSVHRDDPVFGIMTGNYELFRINVIDIETRTGHGHAMANLRGRNHPTEVLNPVRGPLEFPIRRIDLNRDNTVRVTTTVGWWSFPQPPIRALQSSQTVGSL